MKKVRFAVLGAAQIFEKSMGEALQSCSTTELVAVASSNSEKARSLATKFGCRSVDSYEAAILAPDVDAIYIPLPNALHEKWTMAALEHGKHVLCEKSLSTDLQSCERMIREAERRGLYLAENFMCEFHPQHHLAIDFLKRGEIGRPAFFEAWFQIPERSLSDIRLSKELGGGALNDVGAYLLFISRLLFPGDFHLLSASLGGVTGGVDTLGSIHCILDSKIHVSLHFGFGMDYRNEYQISGDKGRLTLSRAFSIPADLSPPMTLTQNGVVRKIESAPANHFILLLDSFSRVIDSSEMRRERLAHLREQANRMDQVRKKAFTLSR